MPSATKTKDDDPEASNKNEEGEPCVICFDSLANATKPVYRLPECDHRFHQNCIMHWFRQGNAKCPLCNNHGAVSGNAVALSPFTSSIGKMERFKMLRKASRKKNAPKALVNAIASVKKKEKRIKERKKELKAMENREVTIDGEVMTCKAAHKEYVKQRQKTRDLEWRLRRYKRNLADRLGIVPLIIVEKRVLS